MGKKKNDNDCPDLIFKTAKSPWQKEVALEFIKLHSKFNELKHEMRWCKWLIFAVFMAFVIDIIKGII